MSKKSSEPFIVKLQELVNNTFEDNMRLVGTKFAYIGELLRYRREGATWIRIPEGFIVSTKAYSSLIEQDAVLKDLINALQLQIIESVDLTKPLKDMPKNLENAVNKLQARIIKASLPSSIEDEILKAYDQLSSQLGHKALPVVVRSSASMEDMPIASFAGIYETFLPVFRDDLIHKIKLCFASFFSLRAIWYRLSKGLFTIIGGMAAGVQELIDGRSGGVMFTLEPNTGNRDLVVIESVWGLPAVVTGAVPIDRFVVRKDDLTILKKKIAVKPYKMTVSMKQRKVIFENVGDREASAPSLTEEEVRTLAKYAVELERCFGIPLDIEWIMNKQGDIYILQVRPETVWAYGSISRPAKEMMQILPSARELIAEGIVGSSGIASGKPFVAKDKEDLKKINRDIVLVVKNVDADWYDVLLEKRDHILALITEYGNELSHASIIARELEIPAVVGVKDVMKKIRGRRETVVVDARGERGHIYLIKST